MGNEIVVESWETFEREVYDIQERHKKSLTPLLFRGQANADWLLLSTLERSSFKRTPLVEYYRLIERINPAIESLTGSTWHLPQEREISDWAKDYSKGRAGIELPAYSYLANLRHLGFPSPLLDWSGSPYVAAYFAFIGARESTEVAIYIFSEMPTNSKVRSKSEAQISVFGPNVKTHPRHFLQQANYTACLNFESGDWNFASHQRVINTGDRQQDLLYKIRIPAKERIKALSYLDRFNLNGYSLFNSPESLMETLAFREIDLKPVA